MNWPRGNPSYRSGVAVVQVELADCLAPLVEQVLGLVVGRHLREREKGEKLKVSADSNSGGEGNGAQKKLTSSSPARITLGSNTDSPAPLVACLNASALLETPLKSQGAAGLSVAHAGKDRGHRRKTRR